jgi:hypothetical protein
MGVSFCAALLLHLMDVTLMLPQSDHNYFPTLTKILHLKSVLLLARQVSTFPRTLKHLCRTPYFEVWLGNANRYNLAIVCTKQLNFAYREDFGSGGPQEATGFVHKEAIQKLLSCLESYIMAIFIVMTRTAFSC